MTGMPCLRGKRFFVTGHTGFKGSWLAMLLHRLGAHLTGYSLAPPTQPSLFEAAGVREFVDVHYEADIRDTERVSAAIQTAAPDVVLHMAAQSLVRRSHRDPLDTFSTNVLGTATVLDAIRRAGRPCAVIVVTSDKCYEPHEDGRPHVESDPMGGRDPYSASKGAAELVAAAYRRTYFPPDQLAAHGVQVATVRAGNVIGGGDWADDRIVPDVVRHLELGLPVPVRNPAAIRPWQHVLEPLHGYLSLTNSMLQAPQPIWCGSWNFGPATDDDVTVGELVAGFIEAWGSGTWKAVPDRSGATETAVLRLGIMKTVAHLPWRPRLAADDAIRWTAAWHRCYHADHGAARRSCVENIEAYEAMQTKGLADGGPWREAVSP